MGNVFNKMGTILLADLVSRRTMGVAERKPLGVGIRCLLVPLIPNPLEQRKTKITSKLSSKGGQLDAGLFLCMQIWGRVELLGQ